MEDTRSPRDILNQALSLQPTAAAVHEEYPQDRTGTTFWKIGFGECGLVFADYYEPLGWVIKVARPSFGDALQNDYHVHQRIADVFDMRDSLDQISIARSGSPPRIRVQIPEVLDEFFPYNAPTGSKPDPDRCTTDPEPNSDTTAADAWIRGWWEDNISKFPDSETSQPNNPFVLPAPLLSSERIPPLPSAVRSALIQIYCPPSQQHSVRSNPVNVDCLARVYLGRRRPRKPDGTIIETANFGLRNYNLHLDQMLELELPVAQYAMMMADTLAEMHWAAGTDGYDVEFVLGGCRNPRLHRKQSNAESRDFVGDSSAGGTNVRMAEMWLLDFNLCSRFELKELDTEEKREGLVDYLVHAFFGNDPYYPRPRRVENTERGAGVEGCLEDDVKLWEVFENAYLEQSMLLLEGNAYLEQSKTLLEGKGATEEEINLPLRFIEACVEKQKTLPEGVDKIVE